MINFRAILALSVLCAAPAFAEDRPYFWRTEISEDKNYLDFFTTGTHSSYSSLATQSNGSTSSASVSQDYQTSGFRWMSPRKNGLLIELDGSYPSSSNQSTVNSLMLSYEKGQTTYSLRTSQQQISSDSFSSHVISVNVEPNDDLRYYVSLNFMNGLSVIDDGLSGIASGVDYDVETNDFDVILSGSAARSQSSRGADTWWSNSASIYGSLLKRSENWRLGPTLSGKLTDDNRSPNSYATGLMGVYTSQNYEIRAILTHTVTRGIDTSNTSAGDQVGNSLELAYLRALDNEWFLNLNVKNSESNKRYQSLISSDFADQTNKSNVWSVWVTKRF
jgi:hypothetical protein